MTMGHDGDLQDLGFTLVEMLASLAVLGLLSLLILAGLGGRYTAFGRLDQRTAEGESVEAVQALLRDRLEHAWPATLYNIVPPGPDFMGAADQVVFLAPPALQQSPGALQRYRLTLQAGELVLQSLSDLALDRQTWSGRQVLLNGVRSLDLAYFGPSQHGGPPVWRDDWREQSVMPSLVRVRIAFPDSDRRRWPDLVIHPRADIDANCVLIVQTGKCRGR